MGRRECRQHGGKGNEDGVIVFDIDGVRFNYRVAGVCVDEDLVLLNRLAGADFWFLPGGRCEVRESSEQSLVREMREELGVTVTVGRLLWVVENFFGLQDRPYHELALYYQIALPLDSPYASKSDTYAGLAEADGETVFRWFPLHDLHDINLVPPFLREALRDLPVCPRHLIERR